MTIPNESEAAAIGPQRTNPSGMLALAPDGELREVLADPNDETVADTIWSLIGDITDTVDLAGIEMWFDAEALENYDYEPVPNGYASAMAYRLGAERELIFGTVVFAGTKDTQPGPLDPQQTARIVDMWTNLTAGVARTPTSHKGTP